MKEPTRWRDRGSGADGEVRALLETAGAAGPSHADRERMWSALAPQLQALPLPPPVPSVPPATAGTGALVGKLAVGVVLVAAAGAGVGLSMRTPEHRAQPLLAPKPASSRALPPATAPEPPAAPAPAPPAATVERPARAKARSVAATQKPSEAPAAETASVSSTEAATNEMLEEGRRLTRARAALRDGDPERALALLRAGGPGTAALAQEREALTVEALAARPATRAQATQLAHHFLRAYPDSPYRARIKAIVFDGP